MGEIVFGLHRAPRTFYTVRLEVGGGGTDDAPPGQAPRERRLRVIPVLWGKACTCPVWAGVFSVRESHPKLAADLE